MEGNEEGKGVGEGEGGRGDLLNQWPDRMLAMMKILVRKVNFFRWVQKSITP
jgi:hypothetical protein